MTERELYNHPGWRWCTSDGSREFDRLVDLKTTFHEKLEWLEYAETITLNLRAGREAREKAEREQRAEKTAEQ